MSKLYLSLFLAIILSISFVSAFEFDNVVNPIEVTKGTAITFDSKLVEYNPLWEKYAPVKIDNAFGLGSTLLEGYISKHTDICSSDCESDFILKTNQEGALIDAIYFYDADTGEEVNLDYKLYIKTGEKIVDDYKDICENKIGYTLNGTNIGNCKMTLIGTHNEDILEEYRIGESRKGEVNNFILKANKNPKQSIDWVIKTQGKTLDSWAIWNASYNVGLRGYYTLNETTGNIAKNSVGGINGTNVNSLWNVTSGLIGTSLQSNASSWLNVSGDAQMLQQANTTINFWIYPNLGNCGGAGYGNILTFGSSTGGILDFVGTTCELRTYFVGGGGQHLTGINATSYKWNMITMQTTDGGHVKIYLNGSLIQDTTGNTWNNNAVLGFGRNPYSSEWFDGEIDEVGIWNRTLSTSEILDIYNNGTGMTYDNQLSITPTLSATQSAPVNVFNTTSSTLNINCNFTSTGQNISKINVSVYNSSNFLSFKNTTNLPAGTTSYNASWTTSSLADGVYNWYCGGFGNQGVNASNGNRTFTLDSTAPTINIITPTGNQGIKFIPYNITLNYSASDLRLQSCWFNSSFNATKTYTPCNITNITSVPNGNTNQIYVYANDSFGNENVSYTEFYPSGTINQVIYSNTTVEGSTEKFSLTFQSNTLLPTISYLVYNNTNYISSIYNIAANIYQMNNTITIPLVTSNANITFFWNVTYNDSTLANSPSYNQSVFNFGLDNCTSNSLLLFNITMYNEDNLTRLNGGADNTSLKIDLNIKTLSGIILLNYSTLSRYTNPVQICLATSVNSSSYLIDGLLQYSSLNNFEEFYNIQHYTLDNSSYLTQIPLYDLNTSTGTEFKITYKDSNFIPVADALIYIQRKYVDEGLFRTVEIPKTGADGKATAHLVRSNTIYNILFMKNGAVIGTFSEIIPSCQNPDLYACEINLNNLGSGTIPSDYSNVDDITFTMVYNQTTRTVASTYAITSGVPSVVSLNLTVFDALGNTTISSDSLNSAGGDLSATISNTFGNGTVIATLYKDNQIVGRALLSLAQKPSQIYGNSLLFIALFGILCIIGMAISSEPMAFGIILIIGLITLVGLNIIYTPSFIGVGATILWLVVAIIIVLMKGSDRQ